MVNTIYGPADESTLRKVEGGFENDSEKTTWVEYYKGDELVHRSAHIRLKQGLGIEGALGVFSG